MGVRLLRCRLVGISGVVTLSSSQCWTMSVVGDGVVAMILVPCDTVVAEPFLTFDSFSVCYRLTGVIFLSRTGTFATVSLPEFWSQGSIVLPSPKFRDVCGHSLRPMSLAECANHIFRSLLRACVSACLHLCRAELSVCSRKLLACRVCNFDL